MDFNKSVLKIWESAKKKKKKCFTTCKIGAKTIVVEIIHKGQKSFSIKCVNISWFIKHIVFQTWTFPLYKAKRSLSSHLLITWSVWSCVFFSNLLFPTEPQEINKKYIKASPFLKKRTDLVDPFLSYPWVNLEFKSTVRKKEKVSCISFIN